MADIDDRSSRESRLLAVVIVIAVAVLVGLARFKYPQNETRSVAVTPGPLDRLAARATFDDLAAAVHSALKRVEPGLIPLELEPDVPAGKSAKPESSYIGSRSRLAVRLSEDWAIAQVPQGFRIVRGATDPLVIREADPAKEIVIVSLPFRSGEDHLPAGTADLAGFAYVCVVEPTPGGPTATPAFIGRVRTLLDDRWGGNVMVPGGGPPLPLGALVFQLDGRFLGIVAGQLGGGQSIVPAAQLASVVAAARERGAGGTR